MADFKISKNDLLASLGYVSTQSGPVVPSRAKVIKTMKSGVKPVKDQTSKYWDTRKYDNDSLAAKKNYLNLRDIGIKVMTEATSSTAYAPMRLNLNGMDMIDNNLNGTFQCDGHMVTMNMKYPNANDDISVELTLDTGDSKMYEVPIESDQFQGNFAQSIRMSARDLIKKVEQPEDFDTMMLGDGAIKGIDNNFNDVLGTASMEPSAMVSYESVDWKLQKLLGICLEAGEDMGFGDDAMGGGDMGDGGMAPMDPGMGTEAPTDAGSVNGNAGGNGDGAETMEFREFAYPGDGGSGFTTAAWDKIGDLVADALEKVNAQQYAGVKPSKKEWKEGFPGTDKESYDDLLEQFLSFDEYKALDTSLPLDGLKKLAHALDGDIDETKFKLSLGKWFPEVYNTDGTAMRDVAKDVASMSLPGDNNGMGGGLDMNAPVDLGGSFGGGLGGDFGGGDLSSFDDGMSGEFGSAFGDTEAMMDNSQAMAGNAAAPAEDFGAADFDINSGIDATEGPDDNGLEDTDIAVDSLDNL